MSPYKLSYYYYYYYRKELPVVVRDAAAIGRLGADIIQVD